jgi:hypothetical protein
MLGLALCRVRRSLRLRFISYYADVGTQTQFETAFHFLLC